MEKHDRAWSKAWRKQVDDAVNSLGGAEIVQDARPGSSAAAPAVVFEDEHIRVIWSPGTSAFVLVTFGDMVKLADGMRFAADTVVAKSGMACLGVVAKARNWYPATSVMAAARAARKFLLGYHQRVLYGCSMGGYAALKFSRAFAATTVIALCPQWSLDPAECRRVDPRYAKYFGPLLLGMGIRPRDAAGRIFILCDPKSRLDVRHRDSIVRRCPDATVIDTHSCGHRLLTILAGTENLLQMIDAAMADNPHAMRALVNTIRRRHYLRGVTILGRASRRKPRMVSKILQARFKQDTRYGPIARKLGPDLIRRLHEGGHHHEALAYAGALQCEQA